jgi:hypothetical protein
MEGIRQEPFVFLKRQPTYPFCIAIKHEDMKTQGETMTDSARRDEGISKGAVEDDSPYPNNQRRPQHGSLAGQLGHRDQDEMLKDNDTDFPEPDAEAEHTGEYT